MYVHKHAHKDYINFMPRQGTVTAVDMNMHEFTYALYVYRIVQYKYSIQCVEELVLSRDWEYTALCYYQ